MRPSGRRKWTNKKARRARCNRDHIAIVVMRCASIVGGAPRANKRHEVMPFHLEPPEVVRLDLKPPTFG
jgi:hypothetical protein